MGIWLSDPWTTVVVAMVAALLALFAALLSIGGVVFSVRVAQRSGMISARTAQRIKHAEFRQNWINSLREQMAIFQATAFLNPNEIQQKRAVAEAMLMIMMLVDRRDPNYLELKTLLYQVMNFNKSPSDPRNPFSDNPNLSYLPDNPLFEAQARFVEICQDILKSEWETTKKHLHSSSFYESASLQIQTLWSIGNFRLGHVRRRSKRELETKNSALNR